MDIGELKLDPQLRRFVEPLTGRVPGDEIGGRNTYSPVGYLIRGALGALNEQEIVNVEIHARVGARDLFEWITGRPSHWNVGEVEYVLGYSPSDTDLVPESGVDRLREWYRCVGEAFLLAGIPSVDWKPRDREAFLQRVHQLLDGVAKLVVECDASWQALRKPEG